MRLTLHLALKRATERFSVRKQLKDYTALLEREYADQAGVNPDQQEKIQKTLRLEGFE